MREGGRKGGQNREGEVREKGEGEVREKGEVVADK